MTAFASPARVPAPALIGREREQAVLRDCFAAARNGHGGLVLIGGEAGIGKTALAESLCREAADAGALVLVGRCYDLTETPPYGPWVELFSRYEPSDALPLPAAFAERGTVGAVTSQAALFQQVLDFARALSTQRPVLLLLDDLHWADLASLDLLRFLARALATLPVLLVVTYRTDELTRRHPLYILLPILVRESSATRLDLHPLHPADIGALVAIRYRLPDADTAQLVIYLSDRSEGNPFFLGELLRTLEEEAVLRQADDGWSLGTLAGVQMPPLLRQVIDGRLARLGEEAQQLLMVAAVVGQDVPFEVWREVAQIDEETLLAVTERAIEAHIATATETSLHFAHALIREALYEGIVPPRRRGLHVRVGETLIASAAPDPDAVAYHFQRAGDARAAEWLAHAGERAHRAYAWLTAADCFEAALVLLPENDATARERGWLLYRIAFLRRYEVREQGLRYLAESERLATAAGDRVLAAHVRFYEGVLRIFMGELSRGLDTLAAGVDALESLTATDDWPMSAIGLLDPALARGTLVVHLTTPGRYTEATVIGEHYLARVARPAIGAPGSAPYIDGLGGMGRVHMALGRSVEARSAFASAREVGIGLDHHGIVSAYYQCELERVLAYETEQVTERRRLADEAEREANRASAVFANRSSRESRVALMVVEGDWDSMAEVARSASTAWGATLLGSEARGTYGQIAVARGDVDIAWSVIRVQLPDGPRTEPGEEAFTTAALCQRLAVMLCLDAGDLDAARTWLEAYGRWLRWSGVVLGLSEERALWAYYHRKMDEVAQAYACAQSALAHATNPRQPLALLAVHRLLGELDTDAGRYDDAARHLNESLRLADACQAPYERALTLLAIAAFHAATGKEAEALMALDEVRAVCTPLGARPALARADALAARLSGAPTRASQFPGGLSAREVEVLRLVAQGMTDAEVAAHLFLSPRTIGQHLRNIYNKLGVSTRNAAARFAIEHHLT